MEKLMQVDIENLFSSESKKLGFKQAIHAPFKQFIAYMGASFCFFRYIPLTHTFDHLKPSITSKQYKMCIGARKRTVFGHTPPKKKATKNYTKKP